MGRKVYDRPGTMRDLAHEIGHVLLKDPGHSGGLSDLMNIVRTPNNGDFIRPEQKTKVLKYPNN